MPTIRLTIEFDGSNYCGWQLQSNGVSVQQLLEGALQRILGVPVRVIASGRTDAGVHARGLVAHFRCERLLPLLAYRDGVNGFLPADIAVREVLLVADDFHARYDARGKWYRYSIYQGAVRSPLAARSSWHIRAPLDLTAMRAAAAAMCGCHDFAPFRTSDCDARETVKTLTAVDIHREGDLVHLDVRGDGFLRHMVRIIAGTLVEIGLGKRPVGDVQRLLAGDKSIRAGQNAPPQGLCLMEVFY